MAYGYKDVRIDLVDGKFHETEMDEYRYEQFSEFLADPDMEIFEVPYRYQSRVFINKKHIVKITIS